MRILSVLIFFLTLFHSSFLPAQSQDSILFEIYKRQANKDNFYEDGLFPSQRIKNKGKYNKEDNNIFFTAIAVYTLQQLKEEFTTASGQLLDTILFRAKSNYTRYQKSGSITYNFWQRFPDNPFPNDRFLSKRKKLIVPDDLDCPSIILLTLKKNDSLNHLMKEKMGKHTNRYNKRIHSTFRKYHNYKAYTTWFGKTMPLDFDICVMANTMLFITNTGINLNEYDHETLRLIKQMVIDNEHLDHPRIISPHYQTTPVILYHLARLISVTPVLNDIRPKVISDIKRSLLSSDNRMEQLILLTSLYRLKEKAQCELDIREIQNDFDGFSFFVASINSIFPIWSKRLLGKSQLLTFRYRCEAYYWTLILEHLVLKSKL